MNQQAVKHQALIQLEKLGYKPSDKVYIRLLPPKGKHEDLKALGYETYMDGGKEAFKNHTGYYVIGTDLFYEKQYGVYRQPVKDGLNQIKELAAFGYGVYFVVNPGGDNNSDIAYAENLFFEHDKLDLDSQRENIQEIETLLGKPATQVVRTKKSLHTYFKLNRQIDPKIWQIYQERLIQNRNSDDSIRNPNRLMRLAGFKHVSIENGQKVFTDVVIESTSDSIFSTGDFDEILPKWDKNRWEKKAKSSAVPTSPLNNPWDIRNFAQYLPGYNPRGRANAITCKCPVHNGDSYDSLHIEPDTGRFNCQAGCDSKTIYAKCQEVAVSAGYHLPEKKAAVITKEEHEQIKEVQSTMGTLSDLDAKAMKVRHEISMFLAETDPTKKALIKKKIQKSYGFDKFELADMIRDQQGDLTTDSEKIKILSLKDVYNFETSGQRFLIDGWLPEKDSFLVFGLPGSQKTTLLIDMAFAVATGEKWLGENVQQGNVLILSGDQPLNKTREYLINRGFDPSDENVTIVDCYNKNIWKEPGFLKHLEQLTDEKKFKLVVADSLRGLVRDPLKIKEKDEEIGGYMKQLEAIFLKYGAFGWVHHEIKDRDAVGLAKASGNTGITSVPSHIWGIEEAIKANPDGTKILSIYKSRGMEPQKAVIRFDQDTCSFEFVSRKGEDIAKAQEMKTLSDRILDVIRTKFPADSWLEPQEIKHFIGDAGLYAALRRLKDRGILSWKGADGKRGGLYKLPCDSLTVTECNDFESSSHQDTLTDTLDLQSARYTESIDMIEFDESSSESSTLSSTYLAPPETTSSATKSETVDTVEFEGDHLASSTPVVENDDCLEEVSARFDDDVTVCDQTFSEGDMVVLNLDDSDPEDLVKYEPVQNGDAGIISKVIEPQDDMDFYWYEVDFGMKTIKCTDSVLKAEASAFA